VSKRCSRCLCTGHNGLLAAVVLDTDTAADSCSDQAPLTVTQFCWKHINCLVQLQHDFVLKQQSGSLSSCDTELVNQSSVHLGCNP
jgi:hypothetical protein